MSGLAALAAKLFISMTLLFLECKRLHVGVKVEPPPTRHLPLAFTLALSLVL
jgi:hypothetical protein